MATKITKKPKPIFQPIDTPASEQQPYDELQIPSPSWFTLEVFFYGLIFTLGLTLRLWNLGAYPLSNTEAIPSLLALQLYGGQQLAATTASYSPLLVSMNTLIFFFVSHSDTTARLITLLLGSLLILLPLTFRRQLGPLVCLIATGILAISPIAIFLSRTLNSEIAVAVAALMMLAGFFNWTEDGRQNWLYLLSGGLAILLTSGPLAYTMLLIFGFVILLRLAQFKTLWHNALTLSAQRFEVAQAFNPHDNNLFRLNPLQKAGFFLLVALILLATAATLNLSGFGTTTSLLADWLSRFGFQSGVDTGFNAIFSLTIYEPLLVIAGLVGLAYALINRNLLQITFVVWFSGALLLDLVMAGRPNSSVIIALVPLVFLAALALAELVQALQQRGSWSNEGIILASGLVIVGFGYLGLSGWVDRDCATDDMFCQLAWLQALAALALFLVIVAFFWFINGPDMAIRGVAITGVIVALLLMINIGWRLNYGPLMKLAYQPLAGIPASTELLALTDTMTSESAMRVGDPTLLDVALVDASPALQWQLRNYKKQTHAASISDLPDVTAIITPTSPEGQNFSIGDNYIGQDFGLNAIWSPVGLAPKDLLNWLIYREAKTQPENDRVILWLRLN